jgi:hypothetical protein
MGPIPWGAICRGTPHGFAAHTIRLLEIDNTLRTFTRCGEAVRTDVAPIVVGCPPESPWEDLAGAGILGAMSVGNLARIAAVLAACAAAAGSASSRSSSSGSDQNPSLAAGQTGAPPPQQMEPNLALGLWRSTFGAVKIEADNSHGGLEAGSIQGIWMYERQGQEIIGYFAGNLRGNVLSFRWQEPNNPPLTGEGFLVFDVQGRQYSGRWWSDKRDRVGDWNGWRPPTNRSGRPSGESAYGGQDDASEPPYRRQQPYQPRPYQQPYQPSPYQQPPYQQPYQQQPYQQPPYQQPHQQPPYQQPYAPSPYQQPPAQRQPPQPPPPSQPTYY